MIALYGTLDKVDVLYLCKHSVIETMTTSNVTNHIKTPSQAELSIQLDGKSGS